MKKISHLVTIVVLAVLFVGPVSALASCPSGCHVDSSYAENCLTDGTNLSCGPNTGSGSGGINTSALSPYTTGIISIINSLLVPLLFAIAFIVFLYGVAKTYILSRGESKEVEEGHKLILWGIIGFVVMISVWALVNLVSSTFRLSDSGAITSWPSSR